MNTLKGLNQWPNIGALDASYSAAQEDRIVMKEPSPALKEFMERFKNLTPEGVAQLKFELLSCLSNPKTDSLPPSSPVEVFSGPGRVETAEEAFDAWRDKTEEHCRKQGYGWPDKINCGLAFKAGYEAGRKA
jgi:hypothetical protein